MSGEFDIDDLMLDYITVRSALETLVYAVSEGANVDKALIGGRTALQWSKTLDEMGLDCECEGDE